jgi:hypothetical protein
MKRTLLFLSMISIFFWGCMKSQTKDSLMVKTHENQFSVATVLSIDVEDNYFAECVQRGLKKYFSKITFIPGDRFREALYPWFEPRTAPKEISKLSALLSKPLIREQIEALGVELLIYVHGDTDQGNFTGFGGGSGQIVWGYSSSERKTNMWTTLWNLKEKSRIGDTEVNFQGTVHVPWLGIPIVIPAFTESSACSETVKRISNCLTGKDSHKEKNDN